jgi:LSD1 subclass zinc finger protein
MPLLLDCPSCGRQLSLPDNTQARKVRCPACDTVFGGPDDDERPSRARTPRRAAAGSQLARVLGIVALCFGAPALLLGVIPPASVTGLACGLLGFLLGIGSLLFALARRRGGLVVAAVGAGLNLVAVVVAVAITAATGGPFRDVAEGPAAPAVAGGPAENLSGAPAAPLNAPAAGGPAEKPAEKPAGPLGEWGAAVDPDGDCSLTRAGGSLTIAVPGTAHDRSAELGRLNAPRALRDVTGDFTVEVKVTGTLRPGADSTVPARLPYNGAGLLVWHDPNNYVRLERAALVRDGAVRCYTAFELRQEGRTTAAHGLPVGAEDVVLQLQRRGNQILGAVAPGGGQSQPFPPLVVTYPAQVQVGVAAVNSSTERFAIRFEDFRITAP